MTKLVASIREAIALCGLKDGMRISFHHHLRNGDYVLNMVMEEIAALGLKDLHINASSLFDAHAPLLDHIETHVVTGLSADYIAAGVGRAISQGIMENPVEFRTHGGRPNDIRLGRTPIDVAFIAAPTSDPMGNCSGKYGKSACGSLGYAFADAMFAKKVVVITDNLVPYPLTDFSISENYVDYVVNVDAIGNPAGIVSGTSLHPSNEYPASGYIKTLVLFLYNMYLMSLIRDISATYLWVGVHPSKRISFPKIPVMASTDVTIPSFLG